ncbi:MAG: SRPBCC family protein, partial [Flavobacteriaceae bacterium]|nr:SRPBCC family protein [Flavobacteriaceae bacterium]
SVQKSASEIFDFLTKVENFEKIMPENTDKFEAQDESFLFALRGMPEIRLKLREKIEHNKIVFGSTSEKFPFTLTGNISKNNEDSSEIQLIFEGKFNAMMAMMIKGPIQNFINTLTSNIGKL